MGAVEKIFRSSSECSARAPEYAHLRVTVGRHNGLAKGYADTAVRLIEELKRLQDEEQSHE